MADAPWSAEADGVTLWLRLTPKGGRDAVEGVETMADGKTVLKARVRAAPEDGKANAALIELIAKTVSAPKRAVAIRSGETSRVKKLFIAGDPAPYIDALARLAQRNG
ncbi:DUF167 family protein [Methylocystis parvus]|uniref:UPF0235 protein F7D14_17165 n=1 Tax=Methylocystis parvus TaxID=134 RepID=A0A6B8MB93_9HYPH|nr:DUF167 family protein [Methylocystis parvus]QGM99042.1 DUF167 domain-containing protein [Methylocystis parvus]WBK00591.1 DUF167 family protein [Methylocystis parvus OBBP]